MKTTKILAILVLALCLATEVANADFTFGEPTNLGPPINSGATEGAPSISADNLEIFFDSNRGGGSGSWDLWVSTRGTMEDDWNAPVNVGRMVNSSSGDNVANISADGLSLYFSSNRPGGYGGWDIWVTRRMTIGGDWGEPMNLGSPVNSSYLDWRPSISADGMQLYFSSNRPGGRGTSDLWVATRLTTEDEWGVPVNLGETVNSLGEDEDPSISSDGLVLFFRSDRTGGYGGWDIWVARRMTIGGDWGEPVNLGSPVNTRHAESCPSISADGTTLYFCDWATPESPRPGGRGRWDLWQAPIIPIVDFNGDGIVDSADMCIMVDHWGENYSLCDIGPSPLGDGIVDIQDMIVLAEHLFEEVDDPTLVAHWVLDEIEGDIASDSAIDNDGTVFGDPAWQPEGGMVDGALQLDGIDDYVSTPFMLNPADGKFSVFIWVKGGAPGQVVLSQMGGSNWLCTDSVEGNLMTELKAYGRGATGPLLSQTVITDGNWHRIGLVWDGSQRTLYVDDIAVAQDAQPDLEASENGLYLGTGTAMEPGSFWSGLIDDVRIYNRAVTP